MTYKVLNNITLKNVSDGVLSNVLTELLVIPVNKKILASPEFKELDKKSNGYISRSIKDSISPTNQNHLISSLGGVKAKKILLINDLNEKDDIYLWLNKYKYIAKIANSIGCKNLAVLDGQNYPKGKDKFWFLETISRSIESGAYIFSTTKNKTAKTEKIGKDIISNQVSLRNVTIITAKLSSSDTKKAKIAVARGFSVGEGVNTAKHLGDLPANHATPKLIEKIVKNTVKNYSGLKVKSLKNLLHMVHTVHNIFFSHALYRLPHHGLVAILSDACQLPSPWRSEPLLDLREHELDRVVLRRVRHVKDEAEA